MKKRNVKLLITATLLVVCLSVSAVCLAACDQKAAAEIADAQSNWNALANKAVYDSLTVTGTLGSGKDAVDVTISLRGYRAYIGDEWEMKYTLSAKGLEGVIDNPLVSSLLAGDNVRLTLHRDANADIVLSLAISTLFSKDIYFDESTVRQYLPIFDFSDFTFYDVEHVEGSADSFLIPAADSLAYVIYQLAPVLSGNFGMDMLAMLESWLTLGDVTGSVVVEDGNLRTMATAQHIELFAPDEDLDYMAYNIDNFPDMLLTFIESKKLTIGGIPVLDSIAVDFSAALTDGLRLSADIISEAEYIALAEDATFESVSQAYDAHRHEEIFGS